MIINLSTEKIMKIDNNQDNNQIDSTQTIKNQYEIFKNTLNDPTKAIRLAIFNAKRHINADAFYKWEKKEPGCIEGILCAYSEMLNSINEPLSINVINKIRTQLFQNNEKYGEYQKYDTISINSFVISGVSHGFGISPNPKRLEYIEKYAKEVQNKYNFDTLPFDVNVAGNIAMVGGAASCDGDPEKYTETVINSYNNSYNENDNKLLSIIELVKTLELIHPYNDFNCRTFCVLILNRELIKHNLPPALMEDPNCFDSQYIDELKESVKVGQKNFLELSINGKAKTYNSSNEEWRDFIIKENDANTLKTFNRMTKDTYNLQIDGKQQNPIESLNNNSKEIQKFAELSPCRT